MKRTPLKRKTPLRPSGRPRSRPKPENRVPTWLFGYLLGRDQGMCIPKHLGAPDDCVGRLTIEHVKDKDKPATGMRAPHDPQHTLLACLGHNTGWCLTTVAKDLERDYLARVQLPESIW